MAADQGNNEAKKQLEICNKIKGKPKTKTCSYNKLLNNDNIEVKTYSYNKSLNNDNKVEDIKKSLEDSMSKLNEKFMSHSQNVEDQLRFMRNELREHDISVKNKIDSVLLKLTQEIEFERSRLEETYLKESGKSDLSNSEIAEMVRELCNYTNKNIEKDDNDFKLTIIENELKNIFGNTWNKLDNFTKSSLKSARFMWQQCCNIPTNAYFDYSGICICATAALENELKIHFFRGFQDYIRNKYGKPSLEWWPKPLLYIGNDIIDAKYDTYFSMGSLPYLLCIKKDTTLTCNEQKLMSDICNEYLSEKISNQFIDTPPTKCFTKPLYGGKSFIEHCEDIRKNYRNAAAHSSYVNRLTAEKCYNEIVNKIEARDHTENVNNILMCLFDIFK